MTGDELDIRQGLLKIYRGDINCLVVFIPLADYDYRWGVEKEESRCGGDGRDYSLCAAIVVALLVWRNVHILNDDGAPQPKIAGNTPLFFV